MLQGAGAEPPAQAFCLAGVLFVQSLVIGSGVGIPGQSYLGDVEIAHGARTIDTAVGASHAFNIAAINASVRGSLYCFKAVFQTAGINGLSHFSSKSTYGGLDCGGNARC